MAGYLRHEALGIRGCPHAIGNIRESVVCVGKNESNLTAEQGIYQFEALLKAFE
jgi:hypothetical protein